MFEDYLPAQATWDGRLDHCDIRNGPKVSARNTDLLGFTVLVAARFLDDLTGARQRPISFRFGLREDSPDFIKLDVLGTMIIVGARTEAQPVSRVLAAAFRARQLSMMAQDGPMMFVPIVVFGESRGYVFYVESPQEPGAPSAWFVKAAIEFLAKRLAPACAKAEAVDLPQYLRRMEADGTDPLKLLQWQPLLRSILDSAPKEVLAETHRQIATELRTKI
jgi:hypothetical protein